MTDARYPEKWLLDRRIDRLSDRDYRSFVSALVWSVSNRTDGMIQEPDFALIPHFSPDSVGTLVASELWEVTDNRREIRWRIAVFEATQTSADDLAVLDNVRAAGARKKARQRARKSVVPGDVPGDSPPGHVPGDNTGQDRTGQDRTTNATRKRATRTTRATRLPDKWEPPDDDVRAMHEQFPQVDLRHEHEKFCDHWRAKAGKDGVKLDWSATWRNWIRTAAERQGAAGTGRRRSATDRVVSDIDALRDNPRLPQNQRSSLFPVTERTALPPAIGDRT